MAERIIKYSEEYGEVPSEIDVLILHGIPWRYFARVQLVFFFMLAIPGFERPFSFVRNF